MDSDRENASDAFALRHPLFWAALALLVINDHVLKGAGVVPGWLTGKLSDFAGLLVAPVLLSAILRARTERRRAIAFALVAGWFAAVKLVPLAAQASIAAAGLVGLSWTIALDSTDLVALAVLPLAWHVASQRGGALRPRVWAERLALGLGVAACVASPPPEPGWTTAAFVVNRTGANLEVRVRWADVRVECASIRDRFAEVLPRTSFSAATRYILEPNETLPLDWRGLDGSSYDPYYSTPPSTGHAGSCDVVMLSADGLPETVVFWEGLSAQFVPEIDADLVAEGGLELRAEAGALRLDPGASYRLAAPVEVWDGAACRDYGRISGFDWSDLPMWIDTEVTLTEVREGIDGCMSLVIEAWSDEVRGFVCVPPEDFPFASGNAVRIWNSAQELRIVRELDREDGTSWRVGELVVHRSGGSFIEGPFDVTVVGVDAACEGVRMDCGGFRVPGAGGIPSGTGTRFVHPGESMERDAGGRRARLRVGRAEMMWATHDACGAGRDVLGSRLEALVVYAEETR